MGVWSGQPCLFFQKAKQINFIVNLLPEYMEYSFNNQWNKLYMQIFLIVIHFTFKVHYFHYLLSEDTNCLNWYVSGCLWLHISCFSVIFFSFKSCVTTELSLQHKSMCTLQWWIHPLFQNSDDTTRCNSGS